MRVGFSRALLDDFDDGAIDAVLVRREAGRRDGEKLLQDRFGWFASPAYRQSKGEPLRLATLAPPCGVHALASRALDGAKIKWVEAFVGGGIAAVAAAVTAGLGVAPLAARLAPAGSDRYRSERRAAEIAALRRDAAFARVRPAPRRRGAHARGGVQVGRAVG